MSIRKSLEKICFFMNGKTSAKIVKKSHDSKRFAGILYFILLASYFGYCAPLRENKCARVQRRRTLNQFCLLPLTIVDEADSLKQKSFAMTQIIA